MRLLSIPSLPELTMSVSANVFCQSFRHHSCSYTFLHVLAAGNSINLVQLTKRANKLGYHTYVGKGMVLVCAAADTKGKLSENACETVSIANLHSVMTAIIAYQPSTIQAATLGMNMVAKILCIYCIVYVL
jgi:hypothetical protein